MISRFHCVKCSFSHMKLSSCWQIFPLAVGICSFDIMVDVTSQPHLLISRYGKNIVENIYFYYICDLCSYIFLVLRDHGLYMHVLFTFENGVLLMRQGASVVWHHSLLLMNSCNKTEAAVFLAQAMLPEVFLFHQFNLTYYSWCLVPVWRL